MAGEKNKEKLILDSAISLFTTKGFQATRMEDVAKKAGISKGLSYFYYKNKEDLFMALTKKAFDQLKDEFREVYRNRGKSGLQLMSDLVIRISAFAKTNQILYDSIISFLDLMKQYNSEEGREGIDPKILESVHFQKLLEIHHEPAKLGIAMISQGIKDGSIRPELQPEITFFTIWSMMIGFEKMRGPIEYEGKEIKINPESWEPGFIKLMQEMLRGTIQASKPTTVQTSLF
ncbi:TetR/AcrR family transcriptional regulator [Algoriphagus zhangzhouensis]|uniref:Transcriptional regulator, TetR family n=1 Tax=Algoriphagus zhangzhouensis TaxID=1073327 RepID=A0A1M7Z603_9BACT|nr:TetR/AcrR family transcriptional regulator [Algoriphagus zhangzhouensis]TDY49018.1 TetR family transcriptional regulator [Algoriphagus zhangzhouensis]SHO60305.1 transcriptional regulator, TetR family [Algoriphagus zhangzhouensis]